MFFTSTRGCQLRGAIWLASHGTCGFVKLRVEATTSDGYYFGWLFGNADAKFNALEVATALCSKPPADLADPSPTPDALKNDKS